MGGKTCKNIFSSPIGVKLFAQCPFTKYESRKSHAKNRLVAPCDLEIQLIECYYRNIRLSMDIHSFNPPLRAKYSFIPLVDIIA